MSVTDVDLLDPDVQQSRQLIEKRLDRYTRFEDQCPNHLREAIRYSLLGGGKRLRPLLVLAAAKLCSGSIESALPAACAVEMIHTYSLIHDDLPAMDDDDLRRGRPSCHVQFDQATAILAGDSLNTLAFEIIAREMQPPEVAVIAACELAKAAGATRMVGGQADDLKHQFTENNLDMLEKIHQRKTGALLVASLQLGAISAQATHGQRELLEKYGKHLGLAFQIVDDLLDLKGKQERIGKRTGKDSARGKLTFPTVIGIEASENMAREMADQAIAALASFGEAAHPLRLFAKYVVDRTR